MPPVFVFNQISPTSQMTFWPTKLPQTQHVIDKPRVHTAVIHPFWNAYCGNHVTVKIITAINHSSITLATNIQHRPGAPATLPAV